MKIKVAALAVALPAVCLSLSTASAQQFISSKLVSSPSGPIYGVGDFNGDGRLDFMTYGGTTGTETAMLQNSNGTFTGHTVSGVNGTQCAVADLNGDGKADFVCVAPGPTNDHDDPLGPATLTIALSNGNGTFNVKAPVNLAGDEGAPYVLVTDVNHDGKPDIVATSSDQYGEATIQTLLNTGAGNFSFNPNSASATGGQLFGAADFNGDGFPDLVVGNSAVQIYLGKGDGSFTAGAVVDTNYRVVGIGDFNKDGHQDLVIVDGQNGTIFLGKGNGTFTTGAMLNTSLNFKVPSGQNSIDAPIPAGVFVGDLNKDGKADIAVTSQSSTLSVSVFTGNGNGTFSNPKAFNIGNVGLGVPQSLISAFGDFNNDGNIEMLAASTWSGFVLAQGDGSGGFKAPIISQAPSAGSIAKGDFNHDGIEDVAVVNEPLCETCTATSVTIFPGTGKNYFGTPITYSVPVRNAMIAAGDINNDGHIDLVVTRSPQWIYTYGNEGANSTDDVAVLLGRGDGTFERAVGYHLLGTPPNSDLNGQVYLVDVNKDGKLDLIGDWGVALGKGNGQFGTPIALPSTISGIWGLAPGDFNNTGTIGLAVITNSGNSVTGYNSPSYLYVLAGENNGSFKIVKQTSIAFAEAITTADMNGDHRTDILYATTANNTPSSVQVTLTEDISNTGNYGFASTNYTIPPVSEITNTSIFTGDFNRDGKMDVGVLDTLSSGNLAILMERAV